MQLHFLYNMELVLIMLFYPTRVFDVLGLLSEWLNVFGWFSNGQFPEHIVERTRHSFRQL